MKSYQIVSYGLMAAGALASGRAVLQRWQWEENNVLTAIMLDWDDVQAVATRAGSLSGGLEALLRRYKESGATHLSIPELTLGRLLDKGEVSVTQGPEPGRVYLQAQDTALAELVAAELQARLPHLQAEQTSTNRQGFSFRGDLPTVAEVGLGFDPAHVELARKVELRPVPRPVGYSWVQPEMIERTLAQAAALEAKIVAIQGSLIPGFEFNINRTVEAMRRLRLTFAYFNISRHQRGDWFLAKNLAEDGLVILAHEFEPAELLEEDWVTVSDRWANLAIEAGVRLCSVRFFRVIHAADPLESVAYVRTLAGALKRAGLIAGPAGAVDLTIFQPQRDLAALIGISLGTAGAAGVAADLFPIPDQVKLLGAGATAAALAGLTLWENSQLQTQPHGHDHGHHHHDHDHDHHHHDHNHDHHHHDHDHHHHDHDHDHHSHDHSHDRLRSTAYAPKGIALATTIAYPVAAIAANGASPGAALARALVVGAAGAAALNATTTEADYVLNVEEYRGYNLDWLLPVGLAAATAISGGRKSFWRWLPLLGVALAAVRSFSQGIGRDILKLVDREHRHAHTHHLSAFQRALGDSKMALAPKPLRKWSLLAPLGVVSGALLKGRKQNELAAVALAAAAAGQAATLAGFRNGQRPVMKTLEGRAKGWAIGMAAAGLVWLLAWLWNRD